MSAWLNKLTQISKGWYYDTFPTPEIIAMAEPRAKICAECPLNVNNVCSSNVEAKAVKDFVYNEELRLKDKLYKGCGCPLSKKTKSPDTQCPIGKW